MRGKRWRRARCEVTVKVERHLLLQRRRRRQHPVEPPKLQSRPSDLPDFASAVHRASAPLHFGRRRDRIAPARTCEQRHRRPMSARRARRSGESRRAFRQSRRAAKMRGGALAERVTLERAAIGLQCRREIERAPADAGCRRRPSEPARPYPIATSPLARVPWSIGDV